MSTSAGLLRRSGRLGNRAQLPAAAAVEASRPRKRKIGHDVSCIPEPAHSEEDSNSASVRGTSAKPGRRKSQPSQVGPTRALEEALHAQGCRRVAGIDEAGRGPLAGPVVAAACVIAPGVQLDGIDDSKKLSAKQRERLFEMLTTHPQVEHAICVMDAKTIDRVNILQAALAAMRDAAGALPGGAADHCLIDGTMVPKDMDRSRCTAVIKGDARSTVIAAASIIAKVTRDRLMEGYHQQWPVYNFAKHKGYPTAEHMALVKQHGACPIHRLTFNPLRAWGLTHSGS